MYGRVAANPDDLATPAELTSMSGLDFLRAILDGSIAGPPISATLNFWLEEVEEGRAVFRGVPEFPSLNPMRAVHGGWYGTLLDSALGCAVMTRVPRGQVYTTLEYKVNLARAVPIGTEVLAEARVQHAGRSTAVAHGEIRGASDGRLYATGSTTCIIMTPPPR